MNLSTLIPAVILGAIALAIILYCVRVLVGAVIGDTEGFLERLKLLTRKRALGRADALLEVGDTEAAIPVLRRALAFERYYRSARVIEEASQLHLAVLSRFISIADSRSKRPENLAVLEDLLQTRYQLLKLYRETAISLKDKRGGARKDVPRWAESQFIRKLKEIDERLAH